MGKTNHSNCEIPSIPSGVIHCEDHSGLLAWLKGIAALLTLASALLGYSVMWQAPKIREDMAKAISPLCERIAKLEQWKETMETKDR